MRIFLKWVAGHGVRGKKFFGAKIATEKTNIGVVGGNELVQTNRQLGPWGETCRLPGLGNCTLNQHCRQMVLKMVYMEWNGRERDCQSGEQQMPKLLNLTQSLHKRDPQS